MNNELYFGALELLKKKIAIPSYSGDEKSASDLIENYLNAAGIATFRIANNVCAYSRNNKEGRKLLMLNSHLDTVKATQAYTFNPFEAIEKDEKIFGLGSNDAGASLVSLIQSFIYLSTIELPYNLLLALSCEEEISGAKGMQLIVNTIQNIDCAIIGEPTEMKAAIGERGLIVVDGTACGIVGHAAREEGLNALYVAIEDINFIRNYEFEKTSPLMGEIKKTVTMINGGYQHNIIPDSCKFVIDIRPNECYTNDEIVNLLQSGVKSELYARSLEHKCSFTPENHPLILCAKALKVETYISPTTSDWIRLKIPAVKMGPGSSSRSHSADEFVYIDEIKQGIKGYVDFLLNLQL